MELLLPVTTSVMVVQKVRSARIPSQVAVHCPDSAQKASIVIEQSKWQLVVESVQTGFSPPREQPWMTGTKGTINSKNNNLHFIPLPRASHYLPPAGGSI